MIINAFIQGQKLTLPQTTIVAGSNDYLELRAVFQTGDWSGLDVWAYFTQDDKNIYHIELQDGKITRDQHLNLSEGLWKVYFTGLEVGSGKMKITTEVKTMTVQATGASCGDFPDVPISHAEQITKNAAEAKRLAQQAVDTVTDNLPLTERAEAAAQAAEASASGSAAAAGAARQAEANAQAARDTAVKAAGAAGSSATAAEDAQAGAETAAQTATEKASASTQSAAQAQKAQEGAQQSASAAAASETAAAQSASAANGSAQNASDDAQRAQQAAANAEDSAGFAQASQEAAATSETNASASAVAASGSAAAAAGSAEEAGTDAATAAQASETAATQAEAAKSEADRAKSEADKATKAAQDAQLIIDDNVISDKKTQSSLKLYDSFCLPFEKTGPRVTCHPVENCPLNVLSDIAVKQERPGEQGSPDNPNRILLQSNLALTQEAGAETKTYTVQLPEPTAKGIYDWDTGEFTKTYGFAEFNGSEDWGNVANAYIQGPQVAGATRTETGVCNISRFYEYVGGNGVYIYGGRVIVGKELASSQGWFDIDKLRAYLSKTPLQIAYKLDNAVTTVIAPSGIPAALPGENSLSSSTGDTTVSGRQDPIYTAENLISRVTALENKSVKEI